MRRDASQLASWKHINKGNAEKGSEERLMASSLRESCWKVGMASPKGLGRAEAPDRLATLILIMIWKVARI